MGKVKERQRIRLHTSRIASNPPCPVCRVRLDGATGEGVPKPDDLTICKYCGVFLSFTAEMGLRVLDGAEFANLPPEVRERLLLFEKHVRDRKQWAT